MSTQIISLSFFKKHKEIPKDQKKSIHTPIPNPSEVSSWDRTVNFKSLHL